MPRCGCPAPTMRPLPKIAFQNVTADQAKTAVIAYEPIWVVLRPIIARSEELVHMAFEKRIKTAAGSDAGAYMVPHGKGICQEYESFCQILGNIPRVTEWLKNGEKEIRERFRRK